MGEIRERIAAIEFEAMFAEELANLRCELRDLMMIAQESPRGLKARCDTVRKQFAEYEQVKRQLQSK